MMATLLLASILSLSLYIYIYIYIYNVYCCYCTNYNFKLWHVTYSLSPPSTEVMQLFLIYIVSVNQENENNNIF